jgi:hypothetical protein
MLASDPEFNLIAPSGDHVTFWGACCGADGRSRSLFPDTDRCGSGPSLELFEGVSAAGEWSLYGFTFDGRATLERFAIFIEE